MASPQMLKSEHIKVTHLYTGWDDQVPYETYLRNIKLLRHFMVLRLPFCNLVAFRMFQGECGRVSNGMVSCRHVTSFLYQTPSDEYRSFVPTTTWFTHLWFLRLSFTLRFGFHCTFLQMNGSNSIRSTTRINTLGGDSEAILHYGLKKMKLDT